ncbi:MULTISPECIES: zinc ribbon domain-containing protein [unclassified Bradyrhizobium]|uniref:FmdB family zinc ribbon protein n=1 Tax=Bradyrhizobium TaxID=374 RepID=UPI0028E2FA4D|nr:MULTISPECIES: zinc ribbon domain-containing protein [unclassified Bradyrhizobium]
MPFYSFHCAACAEDVELLIGISERPVCPTCGSRKLTRLPSLPAPPARSPGLIKAARSQAAREGHLSNYSRAERKKR